MRNIDFSPLSRSSIGFDRLLERLEEAARAPERDAGYPSHNIKKNGTEGYRFELALAGFSPDELLIRVERDVLIIARRKSSDPDRKLPYESIAARSFERRFGLADLMRSRAQNPLTEFCRSISCEGHP
jgi:molecular chaperone IbpA